MLIPLLAASAVASACGGSGSGSPDQETGSQAAVAPDPEAPGVREIAPGRYEARIRATEAGFTPAEIRIPAGAHVTLLATSTDVPHGLLIEGTPVEVDIFPGSVAEAEHVFEEAGEYRFLCHVYCGGGHDGMIGRILVE